MLLRCVFPLALCISAPALFAAPSCSNADLAGVYGMIAPGNILLAPGFPAPLLGPFVRVGRVFADGQGTVSVTNTASYNGNLITESYSGPYTVASDCTIDIQPVVGLPLGPGGALVPVPFEFKGALAENGDSAALVLCGLAAPCFTAPTGNVIRVLLTRYENNQSNCTNKSLNGAFQLDMSGTVVSGPYPLPMPFPFARDGRVVFDGSGAFTTQTVVDYSGFLIQPESLTGTYTVDSGCNLTMTYSAGALHQWTGMLTESGNGADVMVAESGVVISGTLKKQKPGQAPE
jgi:hypothetical protein